ncbi:MAG: hypothetical protein QXE07_05755, partial [Thermoplasmata archaeon]
MVRVWREKTQSYERNSSLGGAYPAFTENIPLLVITAQNQTFRSYPDHGSMQALDQYSLFK